jgi:DNA-binding GntR family transcriptional regulator
MREPMGSADSGEESVDVGFAERAHAVLERAIVTCAIPPGAVLNERHEAAKLGMSRTPFRQALHRLAADGLVVTSRNRTVRVSLLDPEVISNFTVVREAIEVELVRRALVEGQPVDFGKLDKLLSEMGAAIRAKDPLAYLGLDEEFHLTICSAADNEAALEIIRKAWMQVNRSRYVEPESMEGYRGSLAEHRAMVRGLRKGDATIAVNAIRAHMQRSRDRLDDLMDALPGAFVAGAHRHT